MSDSLQPHGLQPTRLLCPWDFPGKNTGVGFCALLQGLFLTQGLNPHLLCLLHCRLILSSLNHRVICYAAINNQNITYYWACLVVHLVKNLPVVQETTCKAGDTGSIPGLGRSSGEGNGKALQYSCLGNTTKRGDWRATIYEVAKSQT